MREVIIDLWRSSRFNMGYVGENEATKLIFQLTPDLQGADFYSIDFLVGDTVKSVSDIKVDDEFLSYIVPSILTKKNGEIAIQVLAGNDKFIVKSPIVYGKIFAPKDK